MSEREAGNWLSAYLLYTDESESPDAYHIWTGLTCIASVLRRNVLLDQGIYLLYPNLYVALVGPPGRTAKTTAIRLGRRLIQHVPSVFLGPDSCSREQLIRAMSEVKYNDQCYMTIHSSEFSSILDVSGILMIQFLTDIYDCDYQNPKGWRYETKHQGKDELKNPGLTMLVGTTPTYLAESMPQNVIGHGFTSRTVFVYGEKERKQNPYPKPPDKKLVQALLDDLHHMSAMFGEFRWDCDELDHNKYLDAHGQPLNGVVVPKEHENCGRRAYQNFYVDLFKKPPGDFRLEGYHWRKKIHVLKVAMLLSVAERDELVLDALVINSARKLLDDLEDDMAKTFSAVGKYEHASDVERIGSLILKNGGMPTSEIFRRNYFVGDEFEIRKMLSQLVSMGAIKLTVKDKQEWAIPGLDQKLPWEK